MDDFGRCGFGLLQSDRVTRKAVQASSMSRCQLLPGHVSPSAIELPSGRNDRGAEIAARPDRWPDADALEQDHAGQYGLGHSW